MPGLHGSSVEMCKKGMLWDGRLFSSQVTCLMGRGLALYFICQWPGSLKERRTGIFCWVAFTNHRDYCWPSHRLCQACVDALCVTLAKTRNRWGDPEQNWQLHLPDWNLTSLAMFPSFFFLFLYLYTWICMWIWMSPVTWTLEKADPEEDLRPGLPLLQFQTATSGDWVCSSQPSGNMRRAWQDGFEVPY